MIADGTILVGHDGSERGDDALALGGWIARALEAKLLLATVVEYPNYPEPPAAAERAARDWLTPLVDRVAAELSPLEVRSRALVADSPGRALYSLAESTHSSVVAIGSSRRGAVGRLLLGSVGEALLSGAPCAVAVAPNGYAATHDGGLAQVGVGVNVSPESDAALAAASALAKRAKAGLTVLAVVPPLAPDIGGAMLSALSRKELEAAAKSQTEALLDRAVAAVGDELEVRRRLLSGDPAQCLAEAAERLDLLVVGSRCYGPLRSVLTGGVSRRLMHSSPAPVLVVPRGASEALEPPSG